MRMTCTPHKGQDASTARAPARPRPRGRPSVPFPPSTTSPLRRWGRQEVRRRREVADGACPERRRRRRRRERQMALMVAMGTAVVMPPPEATGSRPCAPRSPPSYGTSTPTSCPISSRQWTATGCRKSCKSPRTAWRPVAPFRMRRRCRCRPSRCFACEIVRRSGVSFPMTTSLAWCGAPRFDALVAAIQSISPGIRRTVRILPGEAPWSSVRHRRLGRWWNGCLRRQPPPHPPRPQGGRVNRRRPLAQGGR